MPISCFVERRADGRQPVAHQRPVIVSIGISLPACRHSRCWCVQPRPDLYIAQSRFHQIMQENYLAVSMDIEQRSFRPDEISAAKQRFDDGIGGAAAAYLELQEEEG
ncbi:hypothetical protein [Plastoroseomonas hellenica]|uniref:hypothetical protein n=1 Tax=Plastoroseomonas hellenica TaxID=2687306 RepID=UPI001BA9720C|nr:hypothetical protein [Plastoroseomonas hellenica]MBR0646349.1 hypothetical protein [Plastoroseomonas hellenica]